MTVSQILAFPGAYRDSLLLLGATRAMQDSEEVSWASAAMATPAVVADLTGRGFPPGDLDGADANALVLAVEADGDPAARQALDRGRALLFAEAKNGTDGSGADGSGAESRPDPRTVGEAARLLPAANVAVVSVPGPYAALAAHSALTAGLHVLLFSDNVPLEDEVALKRRASRLGRLVMGPGAGTAMLGGTGLGFANAVGRGPVGVVAAAGTGAQEVMTLLDRWGIGVSQVIGVGGRDLAAGVGGLMARDAVRALDADPATEVILLVSKPPDESVAQAVIGASQGTPVVAACLGMSAPDGTLAGAPLASTLEAGALEVARILGRPAPDLSGLPGPAAEQAIGRVGRGRTAVRGFFTGGTLCYEAQVILSESLGPVYSNIPLRPALGLSAAPAGAHICLDLGEEEYTQGRPHPMIDPAARREIMREQAFGPDVAAVLLDVVIGYGSHPDPAGEIAGTCADIVAGGAAVVGYVLGAPDDRQGLDRQRATLAEAGVIVTDSAAQAARTAALIAGRP
ncbi:MAG TPA: FdrA family protein [Streptosporangiaceae bacterium]|nr:FdrA family protein [Streptosporangiaceae bacterium]